MLNTSLQSYRDHIANRRFEDASAELHAITCAPATLGNITHKLRLAADILEADLSSGDIPGAEVARLVARCDADLLAAVHALEMLS